MVFLFAKRHYYMVRSKTTYIYVNCDGRRLENVTVDKARRQVTAIGDAIIRATPTD